MGVFAAEGRVDGAIVEVSSPAAVLQSVGTDTAVDVLWEHGVPARGSGGRQRKLARQKRQQLEEAKAAAQATLTQQFGVAWNTRGGAEP